MPAPNSPGLLPCWEIAYGENATDLNATGSSGSPTTWIDFGNVYCDGSTLFLMCSCPQASVPGNLIIDLRVDGTAQNFGGGGSSSRIAQWGPGGTNQFSLISPRFTPGVGTHAMKLVGWTTSGTPIIYGSNGGIYAPSWAALFKVGK